MVCASKLWNQEDSLVVSQGAVDRGLFNGCKFTCEKTELEQREEFGNPDMATTADIKAGSYEHLVDGIIPVGTHVKKGDALIGKYTRIPKTADQDMTMSDRSNIYKGIEEAIVHNVIVDRNEDDERFAKLSLRKVRPVDVGDKFSSRAGLNLFWPEWNIKDQFFDELLWKFLLVCLFTLKYRQNTSIAGTA